MCIVCICFCTGHCHWWRASPSEYRFKVARHYSIISFSPLAPCRSHCVNCFPSFLPSAFNSPKSRETSGRCGAFVSPRRRRRFTSKLSCQLTFHWSAGGSLWVARQMPPLLNAIMALEWHLNPTSTETRHWPARGLSVYCMHRCWTAERVLFLPAGRHARALTVLFYQRCTNSGYAFLFHSLPKNPFVNDWLWSITTFSICSQLPGACLCCTGYWCFP